MNLLDPSPQLTTVARYGSGAITIHWLMFALVVIVVILGLLHVSWPEQTINFGIKSNRAIFHPTEDLHG